MNGGDIGAVILAVLPLAAAIGAFVRPGAGPTLTLGTGLLTLGAALAVARQALETGSWRQELGGWGAPLGIGWRLDGLSACMLLLTALVVGAAAVYRAAEKPEKPPSEADRYFWPLWLFLWGGLNALFLAADLFNLYVTLEFVSLAAVGLIALAGGPALAAAWRYFLATLLGSSIYLLGVALLYGQYGVLDLEQMAGVLSSGPTTVLAAALATLGLLLKGAVFPLHFWLPAAHGRAPATVSAVLSGVVVAGAFYLMVRLWFGPFAVLLDGGPALVLGGLGAAAILWGGTQALLQRRLKMLIAYSTVSQLGYGMLVFPLVGSGVLAERAWRGALLLVLAHGLAKAALFLAAGCIVRARGHDRIGRLGGPQNGPAWAWLAFALASASLIGLPPTGGFAGKWWLLQSALAAQAWIWVAVILSGTVLTAAYLFRALAGPLTPAVPPVAVSRPPTALAMIALALALGAWALGLLSAPFGRLLAYPLGGA